MPKLTPEQLNRLTEGITQMYQELEASIFQKVANRLRTQSDNDEELVIEQWKLDKMGQLQMFNAEVIKELSETSGRAAESIEKAIKTAGYEIVDDTDEYFDDAKPYPSNLDMIIGGYKNQMFREINNFVNQTLISTNYGTGNVTNMFTDIVNRSTILYSSGLMTLDKAIQKTINEWVDKGIQSSFVDKGGHTWSMERYVDTVLRSTMQRTFNQVRTERMAEYDCYTVLVTALPAARPACAHCQGKVIDVRPASEADSGYPSAYSFGYGEPGGHRGVNCRHNWIPFIPGVNTNNQPQYDPEKAIERGRIEQGRKVLAGRIRNTKKKLTVAESLGADNVKHYRSLLESQRAQMRDYVNHHGLNRNYRLEKVYTPKQNVLDGGYRAVLTKEEKKRAVWQYQNYKIILGDKAPKSVDDYINMKYNGGEKYEQLKDSAYIQNKLNSGEWSLKINPDKQKDHMESTAPPGRSFVYDSIDVQKVVNEHYGTGRIEIDRHGRRTNKEVINLGFPVGVNASDGLEVTSIKIHYSQKRTHVVPKKGG